MQVVILEVKVIPNASLEKMVGWENGKLKIRIGKSPEKGKANAALIAFLSKLFKISKTSIIIVQGEHSRHKKVAIMGIAQEELLKKISTYIDP